MPGTMHVKRGFPSFWGDGSDGILNAEATYQAGVDFDKYSGFCIKQFTEINWVPGSPETLTVDEPCRGLALLVDGDVNIGGNAIISMAKKGSVLPCNPGELIDIFHESTQMRRIIDTLKTIRGGAGGDGGDTQYGTGGAASIGRTCQGGFGAGGAGEGFEASMPGGDGGTITDPEYLGYSGGPNDSARPGSGYPGVSSGAGGGAIAAVSTEYRATAGGIPKGAGSGGGGRGRLSTGQAPGDSGEHTGGFVLIIAKGAVTIHGSLDVTGGNGGNGRGDFSNGIGGGGGGAGGGVIAVFARGAIDTTSATKTLTGGAGGTGYRNGTAGGDGTYYEEQLA